MADSTNTTAPTSRAPLMEIRKNEYEVLRIEVTEHRGRNYVGLRYWYSDGGEYKPSSRAISIRPELVAQVVQGLMLAAQAAQTR